MAARALQMAAEKAAKLGMTRRQFLRTGGGMAVSLIAMNQVFGDSFRVSMEEADDPDAFAANEPQNQFIFDVQTHHVDVESEWYSKTPEGNLSANFFRTFRPSAKSTKEALELLNRDHYVKEIFMDSDTKMVIVSGVPTATWDANPLPPDRMVATRKHVNDLAGSKRALSHGLIRPNLGGKELEELERQVKELKIDAWKVYTGAETGKNAWWMDDEKVAYPFWALTEKLGVKNVCVHKGLPLGVFNEEHCKPKDLIKAAKDFPNLNFIAYHSGFRGFRPLRPREGEATDPAYIAWTSDLVKDLKDNPKVKNVYFELGATFDMTSAYQPEVCMHLLGQMLQVPDGENRILWGTDSIWNGSPQSQIVRLRRIKIKDELIEKHKYPQLTDAIKDKILGLNAARLFGIDPQESMKSIKEDKLTKKRAAYLEDPQPSNARYGWVWKSEPGRRPNQKFGG